MDSLTQVESEAQTLREQVQHTLVNAGPHLQVSEWAAQNTAQLEKSLQAQMKNVRKKSRFVDQVGLESGAVVRKLSLHGTNV